MAVRFGTDHSDWILGQLRGRGKRCKKKGREILVQCLNPSHVDQHPSMAIRADGAVFLCRSCGYKGSWKKLVRDLGFTPLPGSGEEADPVARGVAEYRGLSMDAQDQAARLAADLNQLRRPSGLRPWTRGAFRGFGAETLKRLETALWRDHKGIMRAFWPFYDISGRFAGGTGRVLPESEPVHLDTETDDQYRARLKEWYRNDNPKYRNVTGGKVKRILFPLHIYPQMPEVVVLVEGPTSAIRLIDTGIDALAILGVENWSVIKSSKMIGRTKGVILCFDGDAAGRKATEVIREDLEPHMEVVQIDLPDGVDPGDMNANWMSLVRYEFDRLREKFCATNPLEINA